MSAPAATRTPPLVHGDRMDADEFFRRYESMPDGFRAELIEGAVHMPPPASDDDHGAPHAALGFTLALYQRHTPGVRVYVGATVRLSATEVPEPDSTMRIVTGGLSRSVGGFITGPPELAAEVSASTDTFDRTVKFRAYQSAKIPEYLICRTRRGAVEWYALDAGAYAMIPPGPDGILRSRIFPGLWIDPAALLANNLARIEEVVLMGIASPEHAAFVARLSAATP